MTEPGIPKSPRSLLARTLARIGSQRIAMATIAVLIVLLLAIGGGFAPAPIAPKRMLGVGETIDAGEWRIRPLRAWQGERCALDSASVPATHTISLEAELTNLTRSSSNAIAAAFAVIDPALPRRAPPQLELVRDRGVLGALQPHLAERVVLCWASAVDAPAASRLVVALQARRYKERDNLQGGEGWFDPHEVARIELPLGDVDAAALHETPAR